MNYKMGDIVWVAEATENKKKQVDNHLFVLIDDDGNIVPMDYFGFVVSSNLNKSKENSKFKYNEPIQKTNLNNLNYNSIVKCDQLFSVPAKNIYNKIGQVDSDDLVRFLDAYEDYLNENT